MFVNKMNVASLHSNKWIIAVEDRQSPRVLGFSDSQSLLPAEMKSADTFYRHVQQVGSDSLGFPG